MKKFLSTLTLGLISYISFGQTYYHPTTGLQNSYAGTCEVNTCSGTYYDDGGSAGNYSTFIGYPSAGGVYRTFCPSTANRCLSITFNTFSLEPPSAGYCYDQLWVIDSPTQNGTTLGTGCGTSLQGMTFTSNNPSGCLTIRFYSDNIVTAAGWSATISCGSCGAGAAGGPSANTNADCIAAQYVCDGGSSITAGTSGPGLTADACVAGCVIAENYSNWYIVNVTSAGTLGMTIIPNPTAADYDFALFGPGVSCGSLGSPIRCSYAANSGNTGMGNGASDTNEDVSGDGWVSAPTLSVGTYYLLINQWADYPGAQFTLDFSGTAVVGLPSPTISANPVSCSNSTLQLNGPTIPGATYHWSGPGGWTSTLEDPTRTPVVAGTYTLYYSSNGCNSPSSSVSVTIPVDATPPTISCPSSYTNTTAAGTCAKSIATTNPTYSDNCQVSKVTWVMTGATTGSSPATGINMLGTQSFNLGTTTVTYTVTDASGNTANCSFTVTITDNINPTITCPGNMTANTGAGTCTASVNTPNPTTADNCTVSKLTWVMTGATTGSSPATGINNLGTQTFNLGTTIVTYTVTDGAGNTATCSFNVTVSDNINPTITCPGNMTANTGAGTCTASVNTPNPTTADNCTVSKLTWVMTGATTGSSPATGINNLGTHTFNLGTTIVTYTVTDGAGNTATCSFTVTVSDNINPTITCPGNMTANTGAGTCTASVNTPNPTTADNCTVSKLTWVMTGATTGSSPATGINNLGTHTFNLGTTIVTYTVTDGAGNIATCSFNVTVSDNINPTITCPGNMTANTGAGTCTASVNTPNPTTADNCTVSKLTWTLSGVTTGSSPATGINNLGTYTFNLGTTIVTYTVTDGAGNTATCSFNVTVSDNINPTITCPGNMTANTGAGTCTASVNTPNPTTADNCTVSKLTWTLSGVTTGSSPATGINNLGTHTFNLGTTIVTYTVTDGAGNTATCSFNVTVSDNIAPILTCLSNQTGNVNASCQFTVPDYTTMVTATDNCTASPTITQTPAAGTVVGVGTTAITINASDASGNNATPCTFNLVVSDNTAPTITCPGTQTVNLDASCSAVLPDYTSMVSTSDNCGVATLVQSPAAGTNLSGVGSTTVTMTVTDINGLTNTCSFTVNKVDIIPPAITCPGNQTASANASCQFTMIDYTSMATTSDNCSAVVVTQSPTAGTTVSGTQTVTLTATDASSNTSTCTFQVVVNDNTPPSLTCPGNQTGNVGASCQFTIPDYTSLATATDNCTVSPTITQSPASGTLVGVGTTTITLTATDANGNTSAPCTFDVVVTDNTLPVVTCPGNQNLNVNSSCNATLPDYTSMVSATDNCGIANVVQSPAAGLSISGSGIITTVTMTATDIHGNISNCTFDVTTVDVTAPAFVTCPSNQNESPDVNCQFTMVDYTSLASVSDNCDAPSSVTITQSPSAGTVITGTTTITLTATDNSGNSTTCTFDVILTDNTAPVVSGCPSTTNVTSTGSCSYTLTDYTSAITVTDNCSSGASITITQTPVAGTVIPVGTTTVTLIATDANGNASSPCSFDVIVADGTAPAITCPGNQTVNADPANCTATLPDYTSLVTATDDCGTVNVTQSPAAGFDISGSGTVTTVTMTATDNTGNITTCTFDVTTVDNTTPTFVTCPGNQNEAPDVSCQFTLPDYSSLSSVTDNCDNSSTITVTQSPVAGTVIAGTTTITLTATDASGNAATCTFDVILADTTAPVISNCPATLNVVADNSCSFTLADYTSSVTVTDNCGGSSAVTVTQSPVAGSTIGSGTTTITLTATDATGNTSVCTFDITVADTISPVISCGSDITTCNPVVTFATPTATDNCGSATVTQTDLTGLSSGSTFPQGTTTLEFTATDASGNTSVCSFDITVDTPPSASIVGADITLCDTATSVSLSANTPANGTGSWVLLSGSGSFSNAASPTSTINGLQLGITEVAWVISNGSCSPASDTLIINMVTCIDIVIPTGFTPDGDGTNDVWEIPYLHQYYPNCHVEVYNRWGSKLFESDGYSTPWDGTYHGNPLPLGSYYFVVNFGDGSDVVKGTVTIIK